MKLKSALPYVKHGSVFTSSCSDDMTMPTIFTLRVRNSLYSTYGNRPHFAASSCHVDRARPDVSHAHHIIVARKMQGCTNNECVLINSGEPQASKDIRLLARHAIYQCDNSIMIRREIWSVEYVQRGIIVINRRQNTE